MFLPYQRATASEQISFNHLVIKEQSARKIIVVQWHKEDTVHGNKSFKSRNHKIPIYIASERISFISRCYFQ